MAKAKSKPNKTIGGYLRREIMPNNPLLRGVLFVALFAIIGGAGWLAYQAQASVHPSLTRCKDKGTLRIGSSGSCVATLQRAVAARTQSHSGGSNNNYLMPRNMKDKDYNWDMNLYNNCNYSTNHNFVRISADGDFGPKTDAHVRCWQALANFPRSQTDGVVGSQTWNALIARCKDQRTIYKQYHDVDCD